VGIGNYRRLPKAGLKIEYRPNISGVVANLEVGNVWGMGAEPPAGSRARRGFKARSPLKLKAFLFLNIPR